MNLPSEHIKKQADLKAVSSIMCFATKQTELTEKEKLEELMPC